MERVSFTCGLSLTGPLNLYHSANMFTQICGIRQNVAAKLLPKRGKDTDLVFETHNNKIINRKLAETFEIAGIKRKATFHYSRHTFATIALTLKLPKEVIMKLMGIRQETVINIYAKIVDDLVEQEMEKWESV